MAVTEGELDQEGSTGRNVTMRVQDQSLSSVCCSRDRDPREQKRLLLELLRKGADVHETDKNGVTPLHHAVRFRSPTAVATLLHHGADANRACKRSGATPLHRAVTYTGAPGTAGKKEERKAIISLLLNAGADPAIKNKRGRSPLDYARDAETRERLESTAGRRGA